MSDPEGKVGIDNQLINSQKTFLQPLYFKAFNPHRVPERQVR
jgi:hypothetical protein